MKNVFYGLTLSTVLFAFWVSAEAQQAKEIPRIGYFSGSGDPSNRGIWSRLSGKGCRIAAIVRGKTY
jgi:hypothetical protein